MRAVWLALSLFACGGVPDEFEIEEDPSFPVITIELDSMRERALSDAVIFHVRRAFQAAGINLRVNRDEDSIEPIEFDGSNEQRHQMLREHRDDDSSIHVLVALRRLDLPGRGGEVINADTIEESGVLLYYDELESLHPSCGSPQAPSISDGEARTGTMVHEIGHALQLGHDTEAHGGVNFFNVMSVPEGCAQAQARFHGIENYDPALGATIDLGEPRFSQPAIDAFRLDNIMSIHTGTLTGTEL